MGDILSKTTEFAAYVFRQYVDTGDVVVDATCGNGNDTAILASLSPAKIYAFDIQKRAIENTLRRLNNACVNKIAAKTEIELINDSHEYIDKYISEIVGVFVFNLGYLPGGDKSICTKGKSSVTSIKKSLRLLKKMA